MLPTRDKLEITKRLAVIFLAIVTQGCSTKPPVAGTTSTTHSTASEPSIIETTPDEEEPRLLIEPTFESKAPLVNRTLWTVRAMPDPANVSCVFVDPMQWSRNSELGFRVDESSFLSLLRDAKPLAPDSEIVNFSNAGRGIPIWFKCHGKPWIAYFRSEGVGFITDNEGRHGAFVFSLPDNKPIVAASKQSSSDSKHQSAETETQRILAMPDASKVTCIYVFGAPKVSMSPSKMDEELLLTVLREATLLSPDDDTPKRWHYAVDTRSALFRYEGKRWGLTIWPGGLGSIYDGDGRKGMFLFHQKKSSAGIAQQTAQ